MTLPQKLRAWRRRWSLDQRGAARTLGVPQRTLESWEQSERKPRGLALQALKTKLQSPPEE